MKLLIVVSLILLNVSFAGNAEKGAKLYSKCIACHGKTGMGKKSQKAPMIAGQYDWYIISQINAIKTGKRSNRNTKKMMPFVKNLKQEQIEDLAAYISSMAFKE